MSRTPARRASSAAPPAQDVEPRCPRNDDCERRRAQAMERIAAVVEAAHLDLNELKPMLKDIGEIAGKWLRFCAFVRKWFPRVGWWLLPIAVTLLTKGSSEAVDALVQAATQALTTYAAGGGA